MGERNKINLYHLSNEMCMTGGIPKDFKPDNPDASTKKGVEYKNVKSTYRMINFTAHASKILTKIIYHHM